MPELLLPSVGANHAELRRLVDKLWSYCDVLRDAGVSNIDYVEQLIARIESERFRPFTAALAELSAVADALAARAKALTD